jgi:hypothetical protein
MTSCEGKMKLSFVEQLTNSSQITAATQARIKIRHTGSHRKRTTPPQPYPPIDPFSLTFKRIPEGSLFF